MQLPIIFALVEYSIILGLKKHWTQKENTENKVKIAFSSKSDKMKKATTNDMANALAYKIDIISFVVSALFYILFSFFYWFMLNVWLEILRYREEFATKINPFHLNC